jgi:hypothetical protein
MMNDPNQLKSEAGAVDNFERSPNNQKEQPADLSYEGQTAYSPE